MPQLDPTWFTSQLFWLVVTFVALYVLLSKLVLPRLQGTLALRETTKSTDLSEADHARSQAEKAKSDYEHTLIDARMRAQALLSEAEQEFKAKMETRLKAADQDIAAKLDKASADLKIRQQKMFTDLSPAAVELANLVIQKLTQHSASNDKITQALEQAAKGRNHA